MASPLAPLWSPDPTRIAAAELTRFRLDMERRTGDIIHTVSPVWRDGESGEPAALASCYRASLELAARRQLQSIAFPGISTGILRYPVEAAAVVAASTVLSFMQASEEPRRVVLCTCDADATRVMTRIVAENIGR